MNDIFYFVKPYFLMAAGGGCIMLSSNLGVICGGVVLMVMSGMILKMRKDANKTKPTRVRNI